MHITRTINTLPIKTSGNFDCSVLFVIPAVLLLTVPAGGHFTVDIGRLFPPAFWSILSSINCLLFEKYVFRGIIAASYVVQNRSRIMAAVPVATAIAQDLIDLVAYLVFGRGMNLLSDLRKAFSANLVCIGAPVKPAFRNPYPRLGNLCQNVRLNILGADAFFWCGFNGEASGSVLHKVCPNYSIL